MADALEQLQHVLSGIGLTQLPRILQGLQKARGAGGGAGERSGDAAQGGPPTLPEPSTVQGTQAAPADDGNPLAAVSPEQAAAFVPALLAMARQQRGGGMPGAGAGRVLPPGPQGTIPRISTMDAGR